MWDAPETGSRNTVHRGPKRDIVDEFAKATKKQNLKFGVYYSTYVLSEDSDIDDSGIDWHMWPTEQPWHIGHYDRPGMNDHAYNEYAWKHCEDLIERYEPYMLWGDIDWPKAFVPLTTSAFSTDSSGVAPGDYSVESLLNKLYTTNPDAVINGASHLLRFTYSTQAQIGLAILIGTL